MRFLKSKTVWAAILGAASIVVPDYKNPESWTQAVALILGAVGVRDAISKGPTQ